MNKTQTAGWTRRKGTFQAGEYAQSTVEVTEHVSADGRFVSPRLISKIRGEEQGWEYASRDLTALGAPARLPGEEPRAWLARVLPGFARVRHPGNHAYTWHFNGKPAPSLPYPKKVTS